MNHGEHKMGTSSNEWDSWDAAFEKGPWAFLVKLCVFFFAAFILVGGLMWAGGFFTEAASVARDEFGPRTLLRRYEWFKDTAAVLDSRLASIKVYESRFSSLKESYEGKPRHQWSRPDQEQWNVWAQEIAGIKSSYNGLASEYNAAMSKINYRFCNIGDVPAGGQPLPREFRAYEEK